MAVIAQQQESNPVAPAPTAWTARTIVSATLTILLVCAGFWMLYRFHYAVFMLLVAIMLRIALKPAMIWLQARGLRPGPSVVIVFGSIALLLAALGVWIAPILVEQGIAIARNIPQRYADFRTLLIESPNNLLQLQGSRLPVDGMALLPQINWAAQRQNAALDSLEPAARFIASSAHGIFLLVATLMMTVYWTLDADRVTRALLMRASPEKRDGWRELISELERKVGSYFRGQLVLCAFIFVLSTAAFLLIGLPYALVLGLIAGLFEVLPMIGPLLGMLPALLIAFALGPQEAIWVVVAAVVIQQVENNFLVPRVMGKTVGINPIISILAIAAFSLLFGWVGALLAIPIAAILQILLERVMLNSALEVEDRSQQQSTLSPVRSKLSVLRMEARELADDVRKQVRAETPQNSAGSEPEQEQITTIEDQIETMARELDLLLEQAELPAPQHLSPGVSA